ncbi:MAG: hypothetical protein EA408_04890 [Marinilabiliales bacterium]|nr:MAG: hypothetical protein EA408_04890 [Marinilabiliales bacterium]
MMKYIYNITTSGKQSVTPLPVTAFRIAVSALFFVFLITLPVPVRPACSNAGGYTVGIANGATNGFTDISAGSTISSVTTPAALPAGNNQAYLYYFYFVPRCDECLILDKALGELLDKHYLEEIENGRLIFRRINLSDPDSQEQEIIRDLRVRRQLLLLVSEEETVNLTRDAFRFVERDPDRFEQSLMNSLNGLLR